MKTLYQCIAAVLAGIAAALVLTLVFPPNVRSEGLTVGVADIGMRLC